MKIFRAKWIISMTAAFIMLLISLAGVAKDNEQAKAKVAVVNGVVITQEEYERELNYFLQRMSTRGQPIPDAQMAIVKNQVLEGIIDRELLYQESKKKGIKIEDQTITDQLAEIKQRFPNEEEYQKVLTQMQLTEDKIKAQIERGLAIKTLIETEVSQKVVVTDEESKAYYDANQNLFKQPEQVKASHILIKVDATADETEKEEARKKIGQVQQKLKNGEDFASLAKEYSEGPSGARGGDLGYFSRGQMVKPFEDAAFELESNEVSDIVETRFGYHLIKVVDKQPEKIMAYTEVKDRLTEEMKNERIEKEASLYIERLKQDAKIEKNR